MLDTIRTEMTKEWERKMKVEDRMKVMKNDFKELKEKIKEKRKEGKSQSSDNRSVDGYSSRINRSGYEDSIVSSKERSK